MSWNWFTGEVEVPKVPKVLPKYVKIVTKDYKAIALNRALCVAEIKNDPGVLFRVVSTESACMCGGSCGSCEYDDVYFFDLIVRAKTLVEADLTAISRGLIKDGKRDVDWFKISSRVPLTVKTLREHADEVDWCAISSRIMYRRDGSFVGEFHDRLNWNHVHISLTPQETVEFVFRRKIVPVVCALDNALLDRPTVQENLESVLPFIEDLLFHRRYGAKFVDALDDTEGLLEAKLRTVADKFAVSCMKDWNSSYCPSYCPTRYADVVISSTSSPILEEFIQKTRLTVEFVGKLVERKQISRKAWSVVSRLDVDSKFIERHADLVDWNELALRSGHLVPQDKWSSLRPEILSRHVALDAEYIDEHANQLDWFEICEHQTLPESLLRKHVDKLNWGQVSWYQDLSATFVQDFKHMLNFEKIAKRAKRAFYPPSQGH